MNFKNFIMLMEGYDQDLKKTLAKIPQQHRDLLRGYHFKFRANGTLKSDKNSVGLIDKNNKTITICAGWNYGMEYIVLHEVGHLIWETLNDQKKEQWKAIVAKTKMKDSDRQGCEEMFSMAYSDHYAKNKIVKFGHPEWKAFIGSL